jgi:hypothetical protein
MAGLPPAETMEVVMGWVALGIVFSFYMVGVVYWGKS